MNTRRSSLLRACSAVVPPMALLLSINSHPADAVAGSDIPHDDQRPSVVIVLGAAGTEEYGRNFEQWADRWSSAADAGGAGVTVVGRGIDETLSDRDRLQQVVADEAKATGPPLWLVLIGHGTFDGRVAQFNLRGEDISAAELAGWLEACQRPLAIINCSSASAPFIDRLSGPGRVVVTATKSGSEENYSRFGDYLSQSIADLTADLDKDGQVSLLEAFLQASRQTQAYYDGQRLLATERALLDDNGDARGVRADFFSGLRPHTRAEGGETVDGLRAHQWHLVPSDDERRLPPAMRQRRDELELELASLRERKSELELDVYYDLIEAVLLEIAELYATAEDSTSGQPQTEVPAGHVSPTPSPAPRSTAPTSAEEPSAETDPPAALPGN